MAANLKGHSVLGAVFLVGHRAQFLNLRSQMYHLLESVLPRGVRRIVARCYHRATAPRRAMAEVIGKTCCSRPSTDREILHMPLLDYNSSHVV
ncbi:hypothetical protein DAEQUDRAFT_425919 [Daedalea quercina L-15889]|uniref:Uncharacterized protein n=1 Tax=Daedalea quercina L-15889 TaxID=1314783 RepID=A0A165NHF0_9APHY|nr:hypothetical protein DAEQUDRAFT_425919 [Daedalea quercina L-15889]